MRVQSASFSIPLGSYKVKSRLKIVMNLHSGESRESLRIILYVLNGRVTDWFDKFWEETNLTYSCTMMCISR